MFDSEGQKAEPPGSCDLGGSEPYCRLNGWRSSRSLMRLAGFSGAACRPGRRSLPAPSSARSRPSGRRRLGEGGVGGKTEEGDDSDQIAFHGEGPFQS